MSAPGPSPDAPGLLNWVLILALGVVWGTSFLSIDLSLEGFGPFWVSAGRTGIGALTLLAGAYAMGQGLGLIPSIRAWVFVSLIGTGSLAAPFTLLALGQQHVPSAFAGVAMGTVPLLILPLAYLFSPEEGIGPRRIGGVILGFLGLLLLVGPGALDAGEGQVLLGRLACLGATVCYACGSLLTRRAPAMPPLPFAAATMAIGGIVMVPLAFAMEGPPPTAPSEILLALIYLGLIPTALAAFIRVRVIRTAGSVFMSFVAYMVPVWSVIFGVTFMGETLPPTLFAALALILGGIGLSQWRTLRALAKR